MQNFSFSSECFGFSLFSDSSASVICQTVEYQFYFIVAPCMLL